MWERTSLNQPIGSDADAPEIGEFIEDERAAEVASAVIGEMELEWLSEAVAGLPERHRHVLVRRYGLGGGGTATLAKLGKEVEISRGRVRQLQPEAERIRDVRQGPDGAIYLVTDNVQGRVLKLVPRR